MNNLLHIYKNKTLPVLLFILLLGYKPVFAQEKIGDNPQNINSAALLELESSTAPYKSLLLPRVPLTSTGVWGMAGNGVAGMVVYNTNTGIVAGDTTHPILKGGAGIYFYDGSGWMGLADVASATVTATGPQIVSRGRFLITSPTQTNSMYLTAVPDTAVTDDCTIIYTVENTQYLHYTHQIQYKTPGVGFVLSFPLNSWVAIPNTWVNYIIVKRK